MFDLDDLRAFTEVVEAGGLTRASQRLGMSKSLLSRRVARLESQLGAQLLARTTRGMSVTEAGASFKLHADRIVAEMQAAIDAVSADGEACGLLRIAAPLTFGLLHLAPILAELAVRHPRLEIRTSYSDRYVDIVGEGYDVAIRLGNLPDSSLVARRIAPVHGVFVASPAYLARSPALRVPADLDEHEAVRQGDEIWRILDNGREVSIRPQGRFIADNGQAVLAAVIAGLGVGRLPAFLAGPAITRGDVAQVLSDFPIPEAGIYLLRPPPSTYLPNKIKVLADLLIERFGGDRNWEGCPRMARVPV
ncbi:LysR family transcriptional regulator [Indioceanicola profundi]|uniref:LysR family transcriptional regulator n=1 Tax=Indioceanicola profundi TaxID=2220096 RepID=UPI000E6AD6D5|nr:LysR family transcriptional regulator [Indioceanicola profundi]